MMMTSLFSTLCDFYSFERSNGLVWTGAGSLMWGRTVHVSVVGVDLVEVSTHEWFYDENGEPIKDERLTKVVRVGEVWEALPEWVFKRKRW